MKIIQISSKFPPSLGGTQNVVKEISFRLAKKEYNVEVYSSNIGCKIKQIKSIYNLKINYLKSFNILNTPIIPSLYKNLNNTIEKNSILHIHLSQFYIPEIINYLYLKKKISYIVHIHIDTMPSSLFGRIFLDTYKKIFLTILLNNAKKIIVLTNDYKEIISKKYSIKKEKFTIIPNGIDDSFYEYKRNIKKNKIIKLLSVGRLSIQKNPELLIKAILRCKSNFELDIVGDGEYYEKIKKIIKEKKLNNVKLFGSITGKELVKKYNESDIFISTTSYESFGLTYIEAMSAGLPIITSNIPCVREIVKDNYCGYLCNQSEFDFAKKIDILVNNLKLRNKLSKNCINEAKKYRWETIIDKLEILYSEINNK